MISRKAVLQIGAAMALGLAGLSAAGCASTLQNIYDNAAHDECRYNSDPRACHDSVDDNSRSRGN